MTEKGCLLALVQSQFFPFLQDGLAELGPFDSHSSKKIG